VGWDIFEAVLMPGAVILLLSWRDCEVAEVIERIGSMTEGVRLRRCAREQSR
jgi:hypothetical protein